MPVLVLFDIDGTLVLTGGAGGRAMNRAFEEIFGVPEGFAGIPMAGRTDRVIVEDALARWGLRGTEEALAVFRQRYHERLREEMRQPGPRKGTMPGVPELLEALSPRGGVGLALLTGNFPEAARIKLEYFDLWRFFPWGVFGDEASDRNALVPIAIDRARASGLPSLVPGDVLVVGDTPHDVSCAAAAGARPIAVATGGFDAAALRAIGAEVVFDDLRDLAGFLRLVEARS